MCGWHHGCCWPKWWCPRHPWPPAWARWSPPHSWAYVTDPREELRALERLKATLESELESLGNRIEKLRKLVREGEK